MPAKDSLPPVLISGKEIIHPYWQLYASLLDARSLGRKEQKDSICNLAADLQLILKDRLIIEFLMCLPWFKSTMVEEKFFFALRERFAYSVLSPATLELLCKYAPLVEMAAGNGYNAWLLEQLGIDVIAIDAFPVEEGKNWFFSTRLGMPTKDGKSFTRVLKGDSLSLKDYTDHALFLCWPPKNSMAVKCLEHYSGKTIIFIGNKKNCATSGFYNDLNRNWQLIHSQKTGTWDSLHVEMLEIYQRQS